MQKKVLVDADGLIALAKKDDSNHKKAVRISGKLEKVESSLFVSPFAIGEAATALSRRADQFSAIKFLQFIRQKQLEELSFTEEAKEKTDEIFLAQSKKGTSWFDCANAALIKIYSLNSIFSFDKFYKQVGIKML